MKRLIPFFILLLVSLPGMAQLQIGGTVPEISLSDTRDSVINLSSFNGKVILIDFWASWCAPCRAANPYVEKLYKKYKAKGFEVFAVSLDVKKEAWLRAIKKDRLTYTLVVDGKGWQSPVAERYFVDQSPTNFLLDRSGKIVAINLEGKALFDKVKSLVQ